MSRDKRFNPAFTIVETMLSMVFISILLISISVVTVQVVNFYRKGIVLKSVNQVGRLVADDMARSIANGGGMDLSRDFYTNDDFGVMCTGDYTYVWNYGPSLTKPTSQTVKYKNASTTSKDDVIRLVKVSDRGHSYCDFTDHYNAVNNKITKQGADGLGNVIELIKPGDGDLAFHSFQIIQGFSDNNTGESLLTAEFVLGTYFDPVIIKDAACVPRGDSSGDQSSYCAINKFEFTTRTMLR